MESSPVPDVEFSKKLIQLVKDQPLLYDKDLEDFQDELKKTETWGIIADSLNLGAEETRHKWTRIRVEYGRHRRKRQEVETHGGKIRDWPPYCSLAWLAPYVKTRAKRTKREPTANRNTHTYKTILPRPDWLGNVDGAVGVEVKPSIVMHNDHESITNSFIVSPDAAGIDEEGSLDTAQQVYSTKELDSGKEHSYSSNSQVADSRFSHTAGFEEENEDNLFCRSICASLKRFSHQQKALAKIRIQQVMYEVEFNQPEAVHQVRN